MYLIGGRLEVLYRRDVGLTCAGYRAQCHRATAGPCERCYSTRWPLRDASGFGVTDTTRSVGSAARRRTAWNIGASVLSLLVLGMQLLTQ